ncbi:MAG: BadF/BadG/BcrA/BcrD ATPase family protein [Bacilli bacterium]
MYILGVDGGNTKTDYFLFDVNGKLIDFIRSGTCSHEGLKDSFEGSYRVMKSILDPFFEKNKITVDHIASAVFGLAGVDTPFQKTKLEDVASRLGFKNFRVVNDSFLGIKAGTTNGYGVCSINGTGTSSGGIDEEGNYLQVGGIGAIVGDEAGGYHVSRQAVRACYDEAYRFGKPTKLTSHVFNLLGTKDKYYLMENISDYYLTRKVDYTTLTKAVFEEANNGDEVALDIIVKMAENLARSAGGVVTGLTFKGQVQIVLAGSVWVKGNCPVLINHFKKCINEFTKRDCDVIVLEVPPATGAIIWALELYLGSFPNIDLREKVIKEVENVLNKL